MGTQLAPASRRRWTVIAIAGAVVVLVPLTLYVVLVVSLGFPGHSPTVGQAQTAAQSYYKAIQQHDYTTAYGYLDPRATTTADGQPRLIGSVETLASIARAADQNYGPITACTPTQGQFEQGTMVVDLAVRVTRGSVARDVHIRIGLTNGKWRILRTDNV